MPDGYLLVDGIHLGALGKFGKECFQVSWLDNLATGLFCDVFKQRAVGGEGSKFIGGRVDGHGNLARFGFALLLGDLGLNAPSAWGRGVKGGVVAFCINAGRGRLAWRLNAQWPRVGSVGNGHGTQGDTGVVLRLKLLVAHGDLHVCAIGRRVQGNSIKRVGDQPL